MHHNNNTTILTYNNNFPLIFINKINTLNSNFIKAMQIFYSNYADIFIIPVRVISTIYCIITFIVDFFFFSYLLMLIFPCNTLIYSCLLKELFLHFCFSISSSHRFETESRNLIHMHYLNMTKYISDSSRINMNW